MPDSLERASAIRWFLAVWTAVALFYAGQLRLEAAYGGRTLDWGHALGQGAVQAAGWALLFPALAAFARRFPFERATWKKSLLAHVPVTLGATIGKSAFDQVAARLVGLPSRPADITTLEATLITCWLLTGIGHALAHRQRALQRERRALILEGELAQAQLRILRSQLQPHFLFNTLHAIATLMRRDVDAAEAMLNDLSDLLRLALEQSDRQELPLRDELEMTERYLGIQHRRFADRLKVDFDAAPETFDLLVPSMLLQPIVENAVHHGVAQRQGASLVSIRTRQKDGSLLVDVEDRPVDEERSDRPAARDTDRDPLIASEEGIGLTNTRARLRQLYGDDHQLSLARTDHGGVRVSFTLPSRRSEAEP